MKMTSRDKRVVAIGLLVVVCILGWMYVVSPMQERWKDAKDTLRTGEEELEKLRRVADQTGFYADERERVAELVRETENLESSPTIVPALINDVQGFSQAHGVEISRFEPLPPRAEDSYAVYSLNLSLRASLNELIGFLEDIQAAEPKINIRRLHVSPPGPTSEMTDLSVEVLLSTFAIEKHGSSAVDEDDDTEVASGATAG